MDRITETIWIGNYHDAQDVALLVRNSIRSILSLTGALRGITAEVLGVEAVCTVPLIDGAGNDVRHLREAIDTLDELVRLAPPVLVHCRAGRSRSPVVVAGHLMRTMNLDAPEALAFVAGKRETYVSGELKRLLRSVVE